MSRRRAAGRTHLGNIFRIALHIPVGRPRTARTAGRRTGKSRRISKNYKRIGWIFSPLIPSRQLSDLMNKSSVYCSLKCHVDNPMALYPRQERREKRFGRQNLERIVIIVVIVIDRTVTSSTTSRLPVEYQTRFTQRTTTGQNWNVYGSSCDFLNELNRCR